MQGVLPERIQLYTVERETTRVEHVAPRAPGVAEVVVAVAGSAVGVAPGAEVCGTVVATGDGAVEWLARRVVVPRLLPCGECERCRRGRAAACRALHPRGPVASHETVPARFLLGLAAPLATPPDDELWRWATLADAASTPYAALVRAQLAPGDLCVVIGAGVRGRFSCALAAALGAHVAILDGDPERRRAARELGARFELDGEALDGPGAVRSLEALAAEAGITTVERRVIETTGTAAGRRRALELLGDGHTAALLDGPGDGDVAPVLTSLAELAAREAHVIGASGCHPDLLPELAAIVQRGDLALAPQVRAVPFDRLADAVAAAREGRGGALAILVPPR